MSFPLTIPTAPGFAELTWQHDAAIAVTESPFTFQRKTYAWSGQRWIVSARLPAMTQAVADEWFVFFAKLNGREGTFKLQDTPQGRAMRGTATGTVLVKGSNQTGSTLKVDGFAQTSGTVFAAGDWIQVGTRLHRVIEDATVTDPGGGAYEATLSVWPTIRTAPGDNDPVPYGANAFGIFKLREQPSLTTGRNRLIGPVAFTADESF